MLQLIEGIPIQNMRCEIRSTEPNPSLELLENILFSIVLNRNPLDSVETVDYNRPII